MITLACHQASCITSLPASTSPTQWSIETSIGRSNSPRSLSDASDASNNTLQIMAHEFTHGIWGIMLNGTEEQSATFNLRTRAQQGVRVQTPNTEAFGITHKSTAFFTSSVSSYPRTLCHAKVGTRTTSTSRLGSCSGMQALGWPSTPESVQVACIMLGMANYRLKPQALHLDLPALRLINLRHTTEKRSTVLHENAEKGHRRHSTISSIYDGLDKFITCLK